MNIQGGVAYLNGQPIPEGEALNIQHSVPVYAGSLPVSWSQQGFLVASAHQPYVTSRAAITFDGRLDNRDDLQLQLNHLLQGQASDAMLALAAYERSGFDGFASLIGDWSLVVWDTVQKHLLLASDFAGVRPLYYSVSGPRVRWSTHLKTLIEEAPTEDLDEAYVAGFLVRGGCPHRTPYRGIFSVPPGSVVVASSAGIQIRPFWTLPVGDSIRYARETDYEEHLRSLFQDAVKCRLPGESHVLSEFSGGLDSSSIVCMVKELVRNGEVNVPFTTLTYEREGSRDRPFQEILKSSCGFESIRVSTKEHAFLTETSTGDALPSFWEQLHLAIARVARERGAKTLLTGMSEHPPR